ncbi:MAG: hypothetical protein AAFQ17_07690 [Pseudomonadota bacterium]
MTATATSIVIVETIGLIGPTTITTALNDSVAAPTTHVYAATSSSELRIDIREAALGTATGIMTTAAKPWDV